MPSREHPKATPHDDIEQVFDDIFFVQGSVRMPPMPVQFSRNMTIVRENGDLTLINSLRLDDAGLAALDKLGTVKHVLRIAGFHGMDDPFYKERYGAKVSVVKGTRYTSGFKTGPEVPTYFTPDAELSAGDTLPFSGGELFTFDSAKIPEGIVVLEREGGILVTGDSLQNWHRTGPHFSLMAKAMMRLMGFIKPHNLGPGWLKEAKPSTADVRRVLDLAFDHVLPVHGDTVIGDAKAKYRPTIEAYDG